MSYFKNLIEALKPQLPLLIEEINWDGTLYYMGGNGWHFNSLANWVIVNEEVMIIGCHDDDTDRVIKQQLLGEKIVDVQHTLDVPSYDPIFVLSNKIKLRFFSTTIIEPWTLRFENNKIFVASPSDREWIFKQ